MPVSQEYLEYVLDQMKALGQVTAKRMFGGAGLYLRGRFFGLIAEDVLYFKVDDANRKDYLDAGSKPFRPFGTYDMSYYEVPVDVLEDVEQLREWAEKALAAAEKSGKRRKKGAKKTGGRKK